MKSRMNLARQEIFGFAEVPPVVVKSLEQFTDAIDDFGVLVTPYVAAQFAGVCRRRIYNMIEEGTLQKVVVYGVVHLPLGQLERYMERRSERLSQCTTCDARTVSENEKLLAI
jgi:hypothetical protein